MPSLAKAFLPLQATENIDCCSHALKCVTLYTCSISWSPKGCCSYTLRLQVARATKHLRMTAMAMANKWERQWGLQDLAAVVEQEPRPDQSIAEGWQPAVFAMLQGKQLHKATYVRSDVCACGPELLQLTKNPPVDAAADPQGHYAALRCDPTASASSVFKATVELAVSLTLPSIAVTACIGLTGAIARLKPRATSNSKRTCIQRSSLLHPLLLQPSTHKLMHMCICTNMHMLELARVHLHGYRNHSANQHECHIRYNPYTASRPTSRTPHLRTMCKTRAPRAR